MIFVVFFFKQKPADEMRISDWSSDVCSSDLIGEDIPSGSCIEANSHALARYAALCQEQGLVPMVEPEVLMDGSHDIETCYEVTEVVLRSLDRKSTRLNSSH